MSKTYTEFQKEVLEPNFDGKYFNLSNEEINEYYNWLTLKERKKLNPPSFKGFAIIPRDV